MNKYSNEMILDFFQLPPESVAYLQELAEESGKEWNDYLNKLYLEFRPELDPNYWDSAKKKKK